MFSPDGQLLASGSADRTAILWDITNLKSPVRLSTLAGHTEEVTSLAFSPDGKMLASGSDDTTVNLWNVSRPLSPAQLNVLAGKGSLVKSVIFSPDGKTLAVGDWSRITLWDVTDPRLPIQPNATLSGHTAHIWSVAFSPDGKLLASGGEDKTIILWDVVPESWQMKLCASVRRNLTQEEWKRFMGDIPYRKTCKQWPLEPEATPTPIPNHPSSTKGPHCPSRKASCTVPSGNPAMSCAAARTRRTSQGLRAGPALREDGTEDM